MANLYGVNATKWLAKPMQLAEQGHQSGAIKVAFDTYTTLGALTDETIHFGKIPAGARVIDCRVYFTDLDTSGGTLDIGWTAGAKGTEAVDLTGLASNLAVTSAGVYSMFTTASTSTGFQKTFVEEVQVIVTVDGDLDAAGTIKVEVLYVID